MFQTSSLDIWRKEINSLKIITLNKVLDRHLGDGIGIGITEFAGRSGSGKTQMCLQLCLTVQFTTDEQRRAIFIDTNQGFNPFRLKEIAFHFTERLQKINPSITTEKLLQNIEYVYCKDYVELLAAIEILKANIKSTPEVKLIVIDSFSFLLRNFNSSHERIRISYKILTDLQILSNQYEIVVIITNELTTRILDDEESIICPAFGDSHSHKIGQRILLTKDLFGKRFAYLEKTFHAPKISIPFEITERGIRPPARDESVVKS